MAVIDIFFALVGACALAVFILGLSGEWFEREP
jgi:hypothetical protein